ncbi:ATP-binding protein [Gimesia chilikensis]|uniref:AAA+ ATPase domain-containing protein n=1 Tax=Gimesia chilikensis TaxID=2605989 RepID=A0A517PSY3_9PLAN|nr:ATP-binding protein [Gimesia chilikensis]QDT22478.1 hypothetical protein HG66A1_42860 [Gimesia chilikensis]
MTYNTNNRPHDADDFDREREPRRDSAVYQKSTEESLQIALNQLDKKEGIMRTRIEGVWDGVYPGLYLFGPHGTGKTYKVLETLNRIQGESPHSKNYVYHRGHLTPMGLFELIEEHSNEILVLDDVHLLFEQPLAQQLLLAALGNHVNGVRVVKYKRQGRDRKTVFHGGLICISNLDMNNSYNDPVLDALSSRTHIIRYEPNELEMEAVIRDLASKGWERNTGEHVFYLRPQQCQLVADFLIAECRERSRRLDLRLYLDKALSDFCHCESGDTEVEWRDLIRSTLDQEVNQPEYSEKQQFTVSREARKAQDKAILAEILAEHNEPEARIAAWTLQTGKCRRTFYRRLKELEES